MKIIIRVLKIGEYYLCPKLLSVGKFRSEKKRFNKDHSLFTYQSTFLRILLAFQVHTICVRKWNYIKLITFSFLFSSKKFCNFICAFTTLYFTLKDVMVTVFITINYKIFFCHAQFGAIYFLLFKLYNTTNRNTV